MTMLLSDLCAGRFDVLLPYLSGLCVDDWSDNEPLEVACLFPENIRPLVAAFHRHLQKRGFFVTPYYTHVKKMETGLGLGNCKYLTESIVCDISNNRLTIDAIPFLMDLCRNAFVKFLVCFDIFHKNEYEQLKTLDDEFFTRFIFIREFMLRGEGWKSIVPDKFHATVIKTHETFYENYRI